MNPTKPKSLEDILDDSSERDPHGKSPHQLGAKNDLGKPLPYLVLSNFLPALQEVIKVGTFGAQKYTPNGWKHVPDGNVRYYEAAMRHILDDMKDPMSLDEDSKCYHLAQAIWNLLAVLTLEINSSALRAILKD